MKILIIGHSFIVDSNRSLWNQLASKPDVEVELICPETWKSNLFHQYRFQLNPKTDKYLKTVYPLKVFFKGNASFFIFNPFSLIKILNKKKYDAICLAQESWSFSLLELNALTLFGLNKSTPLYIWTCQNLKKKKLYWLRFFERLNTKKVSKILCCCSEIEEVFTWKGIKNPCYYFPFSFSYLQYSSLDRNFMTSPQIRLGYIGRLSQEKGITHLLEAYDHLKTSHNLTLTIAGSGPLESSIKEREDINFLGALPHIQAHKFYEKIDIILLPSLTTHFWKEQFGRVIIETIASGKVILGSSSGAIPEVLGVLGLNDFVFKEGDTQSLISKIQYVIDLQKTGKLAEVLKTAEEKVKNMYSHEAVSTRFLDYVVHEQTNHGFIQEGRVNCL